MTFCSQRLTFSNGASTVTTLRTHTRELSLIRFTCKTTPRLSTMGSHVSSASLVCRRWGRGLSRKRANLAKMQRNFFKKPGQDVRRELPHGGHHLLFYLLRVYNPGGSE